MATRAKRDMTLEEFDAWAAAQRNVADAHEACAEEGVVKVKGPDFVDVQMTREAADETSNRLLYGALKARGQKVSEKGRR